MVKAHQAVWNLEYISLDKADPIAHLRDEFFIPEWVNYLDGNSLGAMPKSAPDIMAAFMRQERWTWLIESRETRYPLAVQLGDRIAETLLGANKWEVIVCDNVTTHIFKVLASCAAWGRTTIVTHRGNFPTDQYIAQGVAELYKDELQRIEENFVQGVTVDDVSAMLQSLGGKAEKSVFLISHVDYRSWALADMKSITDLIHKHWWVVLRDLCHSAGALEINLTDVDGDFVVGCSYKYLNAWPWAPAFLYINKKKLADFNNPIRWRWSQEGQFDFGSNYSPDVTIKKAMTGTPQIVALQPLKASLPIFEQTNMATIAEKGRGLTAYMIARLQAELGDAIEIITPADPLRRGSHISITHDHWYQVSLALRAQGIIPDFRPPNIVRMGLPPLYTRYCDVHHAVRVLADIIHQKTYEGFESAWVVP